MLLIFSTGKPILAVGLKVAIIKVSLGIDKKTIILNLIYNV